jgi:hypothetical protein
MPLPSYLGIVNQLQVINNSLANITGFSYNALFLISQGSGTVEIDPVTGNYTVSDTIVKTVQAKLVQRKDPLITLNPGMDQIRTYLEGHLVSPLFLNGAIPNKVSCRLLQNNLWGDGTFLFIDHIPTNINENITLQSSIGQRIKGYFEVSQTSI